MSIIPAEGDVQYNQNNPVAIPPHFNFMYAEKFGNSKANNLFLNICKVTETINEEKYNYVFIMLL